MTENIWNNLIAEAEVIAKNETLLASYVHTCILHHRSLGSALSFILANKLSDEVMSALVLRELFEEAYSNNSSIIESATLDIIAVRQRDPAINNYLTVLLYLKGFHALQVYRLSHYLWKRDRRDLALFIQSRNSQVFSVDIHPASRIGKAVMLDHATGIVIGETAVVEDNVSILQSVTLGGTGNESGDRHPKIRSGVMIGAGTKILGNIEIGAGAKIGANSVVLRSVCAHTTVAGVPARPVGIPTCATPSETMDQDILADETEVALSQSD
jgi:serine O-acetyltransferase